MQVIELPIKHPELFESLGIAQPKVVSILQLLLNLMSFNQQTLDVDFLFAKSLEHITGCPAVWATWYRKNVVG